VVSTLARDKHMTTAKPTALHTVDLTQAEGSDGGQKRFRNNVPEEHE